MRKVLVLLCLGGVTAFAQIGATPQYDAGPKLDWTFGVHRSQPTFSATAVGTKDGRASLVDTEADLGLGRSGSPSGAFLEYSGQAHGFRLAYDALRFEGERTLARDIQLDGVTYSAGTGIRSKARLTVVEGLYTYKFLRQADAWVGLDLGAQVLKSELSALTLSGPPTSSALSPTMVLPQVGLSGWSSGAGGLLESRVFYRYFRLQGASCSRYGMDARAYLYPRFGLRAFYEAGTVKAPAGSTQGDLDLRADSRLTGLGLVLRF
jgi:hypothetical protein